jgi:hypothetical protein
MVYMTQWGLALVLVPVLVEVLAKRRVEYVIRTAPNAGSASNS